MELIVVPWLPGPLLRMPAGPEAGDELRRRTGVPIDASDPDVAQLVRAYETFWAVTPLDGPAIAVAHAAMLEAASLLRCAAPVGPAEREYVRRRQRAIAALAAADPVSFLAAL